MKTRHIKDRILQIITYFSSSIGVFVLGAILFFVISRGVHLIDFRLITSNYHPLVYNASSDVISGQNFTPPSSLHSTIYFSTKWGVGFQDSTNKEGEKVVMIAYVDPNSPFTNLHNTYEADTYVAITSGQAFNYALLDNDVMVLGRYQAATVQQLFDQGSQILSLSTQYGGGGIRASLLTTLYLIVFSLIIAVPLGIASALYLHEFAPQNRITSAMRSMIELLTGVPSVIYGLMGAAVFIPLTQFFFQANGGNILSGSLTLATIILPTIIRSTEEALKTVPSDWRKASLALGANDMKTTFAIVVPSALPGIVSGVLLGIGRIVGESAAIIYAIGTTISDRVSILGSSTPLSVHIWSVMAGEAPNFALASAISFLILMLVLILNLLVLFLSRKMKKFQEVK